MRRIALITAALLCPHAPADDFAEFIDGFGDAEIRRTDPGCDGPIRPDSVLPDVLRVKISGWRAFDALQDPYTGVVQRRDANLFRLDVTFAGLVNPSGTSGIGTDPFEPFRFGPSPVLGFLEIDIDSDKDTGGELDGAAELRYLANVARFGGLPEDSIGQRAARGGAGPGGCGDHDLNFWTAPFFERSGEDFSLVLCGCHQVTIVSRTGGDQDNTFEPGETWIIRSRYFQRAAGYQKASGVFGGSDFGLYDPEVNLRFSHDIASDITTITLVEALTMAGAAELTGEPEQPIDSEIGPFSHHSVVEAVLDLIKNASRLQGEVRVLTERWDDKKAEDVLEPDDWEATAIFGTSYEFEDESLYVWTDVGFAARPCDLNADEKIDDLDVSAYESALQSMDGSSCDADGVVDGRFVVAGCGPNFSLYDLDGNGAIESQDRALFCKGDLTGSSDPRDPGYGSRDGDVDADDFFYFLDQFASANLAEADLTTSSDPNQSDYGLPNLIIDSNDFFFYLDLFVMGCP